ncbi:MAG TPA: VCBS repeat-containing protein [Bryobacteraceae bacterium]|nr:VCBS repeat-containing protein [Bryobacteraceae bacterium]
MVKRYPGTNDSLEIARNYDYATLALILSQLCGSDWVAKYLPGYSHPGDLRADLSVAASASLPPSGQASQTSITADVNGDGNPDTIWLDQTSTNVVVQLRGSDGSVLVKNAYSLGFNPSPVNSKLIAADFNGDGKLDLAVTYFANNGGLYILLGNGDGTFGAAKTFNAGPNPGSLAAADFNRDGKMDIAVANTFGANTVSLLLGNGDGTFGAPTAYAIGGSAVSILALDLNGDGAPDVAVAVSNFPSSGVSVLLNSGGRLGQPVATAIPISPAYMAYSDFNHDGKLDLVVTGGPNAMVMLAGKGDGTFQQPAAYAVSNSPSSIAVAPLQDGNTLLITADNVTGDDLFIIVSPQGSVGAPPFNFAGTTPAGIVAADLNNDGQPDVVIPDVLTGSVWVMLSQGGTQFGAPQQFPIAAAGLYEPQAAAVGDLNGDGKADVIVANQPFGGSLGSGIGSLSVLLGNGNGTLQSAMVTPLAGAGTPLAGTGSQILATGDFNRDGKLDVAVAAYGSSAGAPGVFVLLGKGDGTFQAPTTVTAPGGLHPMAVAAADLNGDGIPDLAVELVDAAQSDNPATLAIFLGQGNGTFGAARTFALQSKSGRAGALAIGDVNGDGKPDIAVCGGDSLSRSVDILLGDGAGGFREASTLPATYDGPVALAITDLNGDGKPDLVVAETDADAAFLLGNGDGTFQAELHFTSGLNPSAIAVTKFNGSQGPDLVIVDQGGTWVSLLNAFSVGGVTVAPTSAGPASGSGTGGTFTFTFTDSGGYQNLGVADVLINNALDGRHACYIAFVPSGANSGSVFLVDDAGDAGGPYQGFVLPGSGSVGNSQCTITGANSSVNGSGNTLTLTLAITFSASFPGNKIFYLSAQDKASNNSGWQALGTWGVPGAQTSGPAVGGINPPRTGSLGPTTYTFTFTDTNGWQDISVANVLINSAIDGRRACYIAFAPSGAGAGALFLVDDAGDAGGPYSGTTLPGTGTVSNSQCSITGGSVSGAGNTLTLTVPITFTQSFAGDQVFFLAARSNTANSNWQAVGSVTIP